MITLYLIWLEGWLCIDLQSNKFDIYSLINVPNGAKYDFSQPLYNYMYGLRNTTPLLTMTLLNQVGFIARLDDNKKAPMEMKEWK